MTRDRQRTVLLVLACARRNPGTILARDPNGKAISKERIRQALHDLENAVFAQRMAMTHRTRT